MESRVFPREWPQIKARAAEVLHERAKHSAASWLDESGGFGTGWVFRRNREAFQELAFETRLLCEVAPPVTETTVLGQRVATPILVAPMSRTINKARGEETFALLARGARAAGTIASAGYPAMERELVSMVKEGAPLFWIIKPLKDRDAFVARMRVAEQVGCFAIGVDVDAIAGLNPQGDDPHSGDNWSPMSPGEIRTLRAETTLPFIIKGIMSARDAETAVEVGADAIIVSNHGGHVMDYSLPTIKALPRITAAVGGNLEVWFDSGVRRGTDVLKALALGADAVLVGRVALWGLGLGGAEGVAHVLNLLNDELRRNMLLTGVSSIDEISSEIVVPA
ncbi:MAG: alpha-hydroxy-acid oxidizing protein [Chloroflexi bacterium]|nr:alpha-hydroxy-acid oxidizing protein [Chloroflexota bacterium]